MNKTYIKKICFSLLAVLGYIALFLASTLLTTLVVSVLGTILKLMIPSLAGVTLFSDSLFLSILSGIVSVLFVLLLFKREKRSFAEELRLTPMSLKAGLISFSLGFVFSIVTTFILSLLPESISAAHQMQTAEYTQENLFLLMLSLGVVSPIVEEVYFRGLVHTKLRECFRFPVAAILSALIFGFFHGNFIQMIYACVYGIILAFVYEKNLSLWASILFHVGYNLCSLFVLLVFV